MTQPDMHTSEDLPARNKARLCLKTGHFWCSCNQKTIRLPEHFSPLVPGSITRSACAIIGRKYRCQAITEKKFLNGNFTLVHLVTIRTWSIIMWFRLGKQTHPTA